ncbi:elongation factor P [Candidatus Falkowbacteria bacterium]|jgi:elongation factor P|nr:elongation factor P [Candidatus Falkowbacteria bacterium]MBT7007429.1 elongation factor P [Candidatus Falkowbacteria bacterium]
MLDISQVKLGAIVKLNNDPYSVIQAAQKQVGRGGSIKVLKLKNLLTGAVLEKTIKGNDKMEEADLARGKAQYLYIEGNEVYFMDNETFEQFSIDKESVGDISGFLKEGTDVSVMIFEGKPVSVQLPVKVELTVKDAPPGVKGDTAGTATKTITLETGYEVNAPLFIKQGDVVRINTENGTYVERVN